MEGKEYAIHFLTHASEFPQIRVFKDEKERDEIYEQTIKTNKIDHGRKIWDVILVRKFTSEGERYLNYELMRKQRLAEKVTL